MRDKHAICCRAKRAAFACRAQIPHSTLSGFAVIRSGQALGRQKTATRDDRSRGQAQRMHTKNVRFQNGKSKAMRLMAENPDGIAFVVAQHECVLAFDDFPSKHHLAIVGFDF